MYILNENGVTAVVSISPEFKILAQNKLDDNFNTSPVILDNLLYLRGYKKPLLY